MWDFAETRETPDVLCCRPPSLTLVDASDPTRKIGLVLHHFIVRKSLRAVPGLSPQRHKGARIHLLKPLARDSSPSHLPHHLLECIAHLVISARRPNTIPHTILEMNTPTLINLPPPPSDTPTDQGPGTPNSGTTSLSALSVVAVKDGHQGHILSHGHGHGHHHPRGSVSSTTTLDAERADRISRLAGLERLSTVRQSGSGNLAPGAGPANPPSGYFDNAPTVKERSTVGSASGTGSVGGRTTWASASVGDDIDKMSEDQDDGASSTGEMSDEGNASLVGFGEGASSTISGPISTATARAMAARQSSMGSPSMSKATAVTPQPPNRSDSPMSGVISSSLTGSGDPRYLDGMSYDPNVVDTTMQPAPPVGQLQHQQQQRDHRGAGTEFAERVMRDRLTDGEGRPMGSPDERNQALGKFSFERE
jgi:hypothetical protein